MEELEFQPVAVTVADVERAAKDLRAHLQPTPLQYSRVSIRGPDVYAEPGSGQTVLGVDE